jgi:hypothetical protein
MKNKIIIIGALLLAANIVNGQVRRNAAEASQNQQAMAANQAQLERDLNELKAFETTLTQFETAFANKDAVKVASLHANLLAAMQREIEQSENKIAQDKRELNQSKSETASSSREKGRSRRDLATPDGDIGDGRDLRDDRRDKYDDRRDAEDDRSDLEKQIVRTVRQKEIYALLQAYTFSFEPTLQEKAVASKALIHEFAEIMERDIAATEAEIVEDKREAAEDSRERREDRREFRERRI